MKLSTFIAYIGAGILLYVVFPLPIGSLVWAAAAIGSLVRGLSLLKELTIEVQALNYLPAFPTDSLSKSDTSQPNIAVKPFNFKIPKNIPTDLKCPSCGAAVSPTTRKCEYCGSILQPIVDLPDPVHLAGLTVGKGVRVRLPQSERDFRVQGRALIAELWQAARGPHVPWTFTGNLYAGFALTGVKPAYLLNWQNRFYLFEKHKSVNDQHIQQYFLPYALAFGYSNQMDRVEFEYDGHIWRITDIGRSQVIFTEGEKLHIQRGAEARFIYAKSKDRILLVEDYRSGGAAQDMLWIGYEVQEQDIQYS
ncbi:MAG: hypothetical protein DDG60_09710 [Anaerolineae bacterium]|nr:MAG: hypothetical protein DDG60_09710 [Anaerolineae bacterium]